ncbi:MAG: hypothetical protein K6B41_10250 [Butyrivibrio sp.]|nr:hypothetical protein [Butyrivibrio sp.]
MEIQKRNLFLHSIKNTGNFILYHKKAIIVSLIILILAIFSYSAKAYDSENPGYFNGVVFDWLDEMIDNSAAMDAALQTQLTYSDGGNLSIGGMNTTVYGISEVNKVCVSLSALIVIITFFISLLGVRQHDLTEEEVIRRIVLMVFGLVLVYKAKDFSFTIANVGSKLATTVARAGNSALIGAGSTTALENLKEIIYNKTHTAEETTGAISKLGATLTDLSTSASYMLQLFIPWLALKIVHFVIKIVVWGRAFEIIILATFSPLAFMEMPDLHNPLHSPGFRFFKNMLALSISGAIIVFALIIGNQITVSIINNISGETMSEILQGVGNLIIIGFAEVGLVTRSQQIARTIVTTG